jgi:hypothetical protein
MTPRQALTTVHDAIDALNGCIDQMSDNQFWAQWHEDSSPAPRDPYGSCEDQHRLTLRDVI